MPPKYLGPTEEEWERRKEEIEELYHAETLDNLIKAMEAKGFSATYVFFLRLFHHGLHVYVWPFSNLLTPR